MPVDGHSDEKGSNFQRIEEADGKEKERQQESLKAAIEPSSGLLSAGGQSLDTPQPEEVAVPRQRPTHWMDNVPIRVVQLAQIPEAVQEAYPVDPPLSQIPEHVDAVEMRKCPYCTRSFRADVAARHIPKCEHARSRPKPPPKTADLVEKKIQRRLWQQRTTKILSNSHEKSDGSPRTSSKKKKQAQKEAEPGIQLIEIAQLDGEESHGAPPTSAFQLVPAPVTTPDIHNIPTGASSSTRFFARPEIQLTKLRQAKDSVDQLVSSAMILEIQNQTQLKSRISPFRYESRGSFQSKGSLQSSPSRQRGHPSPLHQEKVRVASSLEILKEPSYQLAPNSKLPGAPSLPPKTKPLSFHRNSVGLPVGNQLPISEGETKPIQRNHTATRLGAGIQLMACQKVTKSTHELQVCSSLAEIEEKMESSAKKHLKKQIDHSDVATRAKMFSSIQCPSCQRKFGPRAADDHIRYCTQKNELQKFAPKQVPARPPSRVVASVLGQSKDPSPVRRIDPKKVQARVDTGLKQPHIALFRREQGAQPHSQSFFARAQTTGRTSKLMRSQADLTPQLIPQSKQINSQSLIKPPSPAHASTLTALRGARTNSFNPKNTVQQHVNRMSTWNAKHKVAHQHTLSGGASPRRMPHTGMPYAAYAPKQQSSARQQYQPMYKPDAVQAPRSLTDSNTSIPKPKPIPYQTLFKPTIQDINESIGEAHSKFCTNCGSKFENTTHKFCGDCGTCRQMI